VRREEVVSPRAASRLWTPAWIAVVLAVAATSLAGVLDNGFVWDDGPFILWNQSLSGPGTLLRVVTAGDAYGTGGVNPYYRPVTTLSFAADRWLYGDNPVGYHGTNLLLHLAVCAQVFLAALKLSGRRAAAGAAALLFAVHPACVEPVAYVSARADLLCAAFVLAALLLYLRGRERGSSRLLGLAALAFAAALLAKIVALVLLPVLALREALLARPGERRARPLLPFAALAGAFLIARPLVLEKTTWESGAPFLMRLATAGPLLLEYLRNTLLPFGLKVFYDVVLRVSWADPVVVLAWAVVAACGAAWLLLLRRRPLTALGGAWFVVALFPVSGVVDLLYPALMADRYLYIPLAGAALAVAGALPDPGAWDPRRMPARRLAATGAACAALIACVSAFAGTAARLVPAWRDPVTFWEQARHDAPTSPYVLNALGWSYWQVNRLEEADQVLARAAALAPNSTDVKINLAAVAFLRGDVEAAARYTEQTLRINPRDSVALRYRGVLLQGQGSIALAIEALRAAVDADPFDERSREYLQELTAEAEREL
jgi:tetratricopeptide (TPR) repeat protein